ncbi:DedA family protein [Pragia fontium]|uniref:Membrane protein DedA, SNARE-associated domain n=1 Tax=Pragia fontium DSM 5563 = ATCC 49100 TaxID=1122977 RepID=A0AAJ4W9B0_9GAMM|nr:DedA family protein [Pragia fontium]AKJ42014.1 membrane protein [Pragia fontium]SFC45488.1 membrane protein DedA, SNARE-associated domain [Pragia fontium DSM 5563 = ATCC 49100]VEJ55025.1 Inner membrane protein YghB [Pragia fontium]
MGSITDLFQALIHQDFKTLANPEFLWSIYGILFIIIFLENGLLPAAFLPGDSLLLLAGALVAQGSLHFALTVVVLSVAAALGCWFSYLQGRWLGKTKIVQGWMAKIPAHYHQRAHQLFYRHGFFALLIGRFLAFVRTLLPTIAGLSALDAKRFQIFNWLSAVLWVSVVTGLGYLISLTPFFKHNQTAVMNGLMILPVALLVIGLAGSLIVVLKKKSDKK